LTTPTSSAVDRAAWESDVLRYCRQVVLKTMLMVRGSMRGSQRLRLAEASAQLRVDKSPENPTRRIDEDAEDLIVSALVKKFAKLPGLGAFTVFGEESGIRTFPDAALEREADLVVFVDGIDGTEFVERQQGGWCLLAVYDRREDEMLAAVAGDIFLDRLFWAGRSAEAEALDFITHSWFRLDGGANPRRDLTGACINVLSTKASRFRAVAQKVSLLDAVEAAGGRINLAWGSNMILQVAAGYADAAVEFARGFSSYDLLPGLFIGERAGLTILDLEGRPISTRLDLDRLFHAYRRDPRHPERTTFVAAKHPGLAQRLVRLLRDNAGGDRTMADGTSSPERPVEAGAVRPSDGVE